MKKIVSIFLICVLMSGLSGLNNKAQAAEKQRAGIVNTASGNLNIRSSASLSAPIKTSVAKNSFLTVLSVNGNFYYVRYAADSYGYCYSSYIKIVSDNTATVNTSWGNLNVRSGASVNFSIKDKLKKGENVIILSSSGSWSKILYYGNKTGFVSNTYLKTSDSEYSKISLSVPSFKQTDSRWANVKLGASGKTIAKIGCATTSIAMMESYRNGYNIYPHIMVGKLSYSSSGNVYWPSYYKVTTNSNGYLKAFYELLKLGKPILFGSKNYNGSQHWVVVTGFKGGELKSENFTIYDPGSNSRVLLSQFISAYPVFYKYFSY